MDEDASQLTSRISRARLTRLVGQGRDRWPEARIVQCGVRRSSTINYNTSQNGIPCELRSKYKHQNQAATWVKVKQFLEILQKQTNHTFAAT